MSAREVAARALHRLEDDCQSPDHCPDWSFWKDDADAVLAALAADPDTVERAARALVPPMANPLGLTDANWAHYRNLARAALAAALTPDGDDDRA